MTKRTARRRPQPVRVEALPFIEAQKDDTWRNEHARLTAEGYALDRFIKTRVDRRTMKAYCRLVWAKRGVQPDGTRLILSFEHSFTVDLRKHVR